MEKSIKVDYELPSAVEALKQGWLSTFQSAATASGLLAAIEAQLLVFFKDNDTFNPDTNKAHIQAILGLTYVGLILSISATISALVLTDEFAELPLQAAKSDLEALKTGTFVGTCLALLKTHGLRSSAVMIIYHWLLCLMSAALCTMAQAAIFVWSQEAVALKVAVLCIVLFALLPLFYLLIPRSSK